MNLQRIKSRIHSISEIEKITRAMQLVATAKLTRLRVHNHNIRRYYHALIEPHLSLIALHGLLTFNTLAQRSPDVRRRVYIVFFSSLGLCGNYNMLLQRYLHNIIAPDDLIIAFGTKATTLLADRLPQIVIHYPHIPDVITDALLSQITANILTLLREDTTLDSLYFVYNRYLNSLTIAPDHVNLFATHHTPLPPSPSYQCVVEPKSIDELLAITLPMLLRAAVGYYYTQSKLSEISSRRNAMDSATDNARELIDELELAYNRTRQTKITQEINEIVAANLGGG